MELTYYRKDDYDKLNRAQKHELWEWQLENKKRKQGNSDDKHTISAMKQQIQELKELVESKSKSSDDNGNKNHLSLKRPPIQRTQEDTL